ncbi:MAG: HEAT repeat domain-containing protein [Planctomycetota bacterium]|nr:HEAT repeat domain-containing protein [Planctomycetota bacterium]
MKTELAGRVEPPPESPDWLGFAPATEGDLMELEQRLGVILPPSYRAFLLTSNGWRRTTRFIDRIRPTQEVNWFRVENEQWVEVYSDSGSPLADEEYYDYGEDGAPDHRNGHMPSLLQISDVDDGVYLLNPEGVTPDGEWEAWFFANWVPGAKRYPSFAHLMLHEYRSFACLGGVKGADRGLPTLEAPGPDVPRVPAQRIRKKAAKAPSLESLIEQMRSPDERPRAKAVRTFFGKLKERPRAKRRPDLVQPLADLFYASRDVGVRCACVAALTELAENGPAPGPLYDALSDPDPEVVLQGIFAITYFPDPRVLEPLCRFIESRANVLFNESAMQALREMGDERAVPTLVNVLLDTRNSFDQSFCTAAIALAQCGSRGFDALVVALGHEDARVRLAAVVGLDTSGDPRAAAYLDRMEGDPDPSVRDRARVRVGNPWK